MDRERVLFNLSARLMEVVVGKNEKARKFTTKIWRNSIAPYIRENIRQRDKNMIYISCAQSIPPAIYCHGQQHSNASKISTAMEDEDVNCCAKEAMENEKKELHKELGPLGWSCNLCRQRLTRTGGHFMGNISLGQVPPKQDVSQERIQADIAKVRLPRVCTSVWRNIECTWAKVNSYKWTVRETEKKTDNKRITWDQSPLLSWCLYTPPLIPTINKNLSWPSWSQMRKADPRVVNRQHCVLSDVRSRHFGFSFNPGSSFLQHSNVFVNLFPSSR